MSNLPETTSTLAGTRDREKTADLLGQALAQGYLQVDEYDQRLQTVFQTHTAEELHELTAGLPLDRIRRHDPRRRAARIAAARRGVRAHLYAYFAMCVIVLTVWAAVAVTTDADLLLADLAHPRRGDRPRQPRLIGTGRQAKALATNASDPRVVETPCAPGDYDAVAYCSTGSEESTWP